MKADLGEAVVHLTDENWHRYFCPADTVTELTRVNFWQPSPIRFVKSAGTPFFFRLKSPHKAIAGYGTFTEQQVLPLAAMWKRFTTANGVPTLDRLVSLLSQYHHGSTPTQILQRDISCLIISDAIFFPSEMWIPWRDSKGWNDSTQRFKSYKAKDNPDETRQLFKIFRAIGNEVAYLNDHAQREPTLTDDSSKLTLTTRRLRDVAFQKEVRANYGGRCAVCGEGLQSPLGLPEVQSAHIYPKGQKGRDDPRNGICLCRRHHWAFDVGWIAVGDDLRILVRDDLPQEDRYNFIRRYEGKLIRTPPNSEQRPHPLFLRSHRLLQGFEDGN